MGQGASRRPGRGIKQMIEYITTWLQLKTDRRAVTALEYGLIAALISVIITVLTLLGTKLNTTFGTISNKL